MTAATPLPAPSSPTATIADLLRAIDRLSQARIAVFGDLCLDAYWWLDESQQEHSLETGLPVGRVGRQQYGLGAAGNVAVCARALGASVELIGVIGDDGFGEQALTLARSHGLGTTEIIREPTWQTMVYAKPMTRAGEQPRFDFGAGNRLTTELAHRLGAALERAAERCGVIVLNLQMGEVLANPDLLTVINSVIARHPRTRFLVDARSGAGEYQGADLKLNTAEALRLTARGDTSPTTDIPTTEETVIAVARDLARTRHVRVCITRGERGLVLADGAQVAVIPGIVARGEIDPVGAGDAVTATLAAAFAVGTPADTAARLANLAGAVTVRKLHTTGTASPDELRSLAVEGDYLHAPELAEDRHRARYLSGSEIEIVRDVAHPRITHAIFDHDGTISTLRQGWESVMEPMMLRAVLGRDPDAATADLRQRALTAVRELIDRTTGIQTLAQMQELTGLVRSFEQVPHTAILDCHGYKQIYNEALLERIWARVARLDAGELQPADFIIHGAVELLQQLHDRGIRLYLASGTDQADVIAEATALGYAHLFDGGIHGAVGDLAVEAKRDVMDRIMRDNHISGAELLVIGDGPVEIREGRRRGAICLGIASDEPRRFGVDWAKRARLIRAGADLIVGDFTQRHRLMPALGLA